MNFRLALRIVACLLLVGFGIPVGADHRALGPGTAVDAPTRAPVMAESYTFLPLAVQSDTVIVQPGSCSEIQRAIDALPTAGGQVVLLGGTYTCGTAVVIDRDNVTLRGEGPTTVLRLVDAANAPVLVVGQRTTPVGAVRHDVRVSDLVIDGNRQGQTQECWGGPCDSGGLTHIRNNGITLRGVSDVRVERVTVYGARSGGLVVEKGSRRVVVNDLRSFDHHFDGLAGYETQESVFSRLQIHDNAYAGLSFDIGFNGNIIGDAMISGNGKQGIFMRDARDNLFQGIQITDSGEQGIFLAQVDGDASKPAAGNTFTGLVVSRSAGVGLRVNDASCEDNLVVAAQFANNPAGCISEAVPDLVHQTGVICR